MLRMTIRRAFLAATLACACASGQGTGYLNDASSRRATLVASLVNPNNGYSQLRLSHYATGNQDDWDRLPVWNPDAEPLTASDQTRATAPLSPSATPTVIDPSAARGDADALVELGKRAFDHYPVQLAQYTEADLARGRVLSDYGAPTSASGQVAGFVRVRTAAGVHLAFTCATCHRSESGLIGVASSKLDVGRMMADASNGQDPREALLLAWGPGRVDVSSMDAAEPVRIPDLRPVRELGFLHHTASVKQRDVSTLAIRLETLIIVSNSQTIRPPREVALGLAMYLWSLADGLSPRATVTVEEKRGQTLFTASCANCHAPPSFAGAPVAMKVIGTDPVVGNSADRHTGNYRVPSLLGVTDRGPLMHDSSARTLEELFDPTRVKPDYLDPFGKPILGHTYGLDLAAVDRAALVAYLKTL